MNTDKCLVTVILSTDHPQLRLLGRLRPGSLTGLSALHLYLKFDMGVVSRLPFSPLLLRGRLFLLP